MLGTNCCQQGNWPRNFLAVARKLLYSTQRSRIDTAWCQGRISNWRPLYRNCQMFKWQRDLNVDNLKGACDVLCKAGIKLGATGHSFAVKDRLIWKFVVEREKRQRVTPRVVCGGGGSTEALFGSPRASFPAINSRAGARRPPSHSRRRLPNASRTLPHRH